MELYRDIFMKCLNLHSANIAQDRKWHWTYLLGPNIWLKINRSLKNSQTSYSLIHVLKKNFLLHLQTWANSNIYPLLWSILLSFNFLIATLFFFLSSLVSVLVVRHILTLFPNTTMVDPIGNKLHLELF